MALDILLIPTMVAECERVSSSYGHLISDRRCRIGDDLVKATECLRSWWMQKLITFGGDGMEEEEEE
jgi:hypothetical protein